MSNQVIVLKSGEVEFRFGADLRTRLPIEDAAKLCRDGLVALNWVEIEEVGMQVGDGQMIAMPPQKVREWLERLRVSGSSQSTTVRRRASLHGPWQAEDEPDPEELARRRMVRRFAKEPAAKPPAEKAAAPKRAVREILVTNPDLPTLFDDPVEQLQYEVRHAYLSTVPPTQRAQWPLSDYDVLDSFMFDLSNQHGALSRAQIIACVVDVVSGRMTDVNSRRPGPYAMVAATTAAQW